MDILSKKNLLKDGRIQRWPKKKEEKYAVLAFIASQILPETILSEKEINQIIMRNIQFDDYALIRRELIERGLLMRTRDCREYWRNGAEMYKIEKMDIMDYAEIRALWESTEGVGLSGSDDSKEAMVKFLAKNPDTCFVAKNDNEIIGTIMAGSDARRGHIYHLAVTPPHRNSGIGRTLLDRAEAALRKEGITKAFLVAFKANGIGNSFWEGAGYKTREDLNYRDKRIAD